MTVTQSGPKLGATLSGRKRNSIMNILSKGNIIAGPGDQPKPPKPIPTQPIPTNTGGGGGGGTGGGSGTGGGGGTSGLPGIPPATPGTVPTALVSPTQAVAYAGQLAALRNQYLTDLAQNRLTAKAGVLAGKTAIAGIVQQRNVDISGQENAAAGAGRLGGSYDLGQRSGIVAGAAGDVVAQQQAIATAKQGRQLGNIQAANAYETGIYGVASDQAAAQAQAQATALQNGLFDPNSANYAAIYKAVVARLTANGYSREPKKRRGTGGAPRTDRTGGGVYGYQDDGTYNQYPQQT